MILHALQLSLLVVSFATLFISVIGTGLGFLLAKKNFRGKDFLDAVLTLPMVLPPTVTGYYLILLLGKRGILGAFIFSATGWTVTFTWIGAVIASTVVALPLMIKSARAAIESINADYEIASCIMGKSELETFFRITLPLA
jgi:molybdate transport system permease protein